MTQRVPFQRWRIFLFAMKHAWLAGQAKSRNQLKVFEAHKSLAELGNIAMQAARTGQHNHFLRALDTVKFSRMDDDELEKMLSGTHKDVPEWLRKDRK